jgi:hypothetical protein
VKYVHQLVIIFLLVVSQLVLATSHAGNKITKLEFQTLALKHNFSRSENKTLWLDKEIQQKLSQILNHNYPKLRLRYKQFKDKSSFQTIWFLDEIGKERPISFGISIINDRVDLIKVIKFRESRGGEIQMTAFSEQFTQATLNRDLQLDKHIDGITGATMSVSAMKKIARVALTLHHLVSSKELIE